ncbi:hypothetical protein ABDK00_016970 [Niabella insulamsoli]|uniref:hypothetical protein n=1 Tax=Niabella insulamsoli TaxID=3144874 RepID=UPI0031FD2544
MNNPATTQQKSAIGAICSRLGIDKEQKADLVRQFSYDRTDTSRELTVIEARAMIDHLSRQVKPDARREKMVGKIFYYAHELGWVKKNKEGRIVADGQAVDAWMLKYSYLHKKLNRYNFEELPKLVSQFEAFYKSTLK